MSDLFGNSGDEFDPEDRPIPSRASNPVLKKVESVNWGKETRPLAELLRPKSLGDLLGQEDLVAPEAPLRKLIESGRVTSMIFWGPPGCGKTSLARLIANHVDADFVTLSAVTSSVRDVRAVVDTAKGNLKYNRRTILFIDEIHRFNKAQQDAFLPHVESGRITLIGATTENPSFSVISPLLSRCRVFILKPISDDALLDLLRRAVVYINEHREKDALEINASDEGLKAIVQLSDGDARRAFGMLEVASSLKLARKEETEISRDDVASVAQRTLMYDKEGEEHYNLISALHKTLRSSDPHGAVYWLGRMLTAGENPIYVARRMVRFATEDIGLADPQALVQAMEALRSYQLLGSPEGELALYQCALYLAMAPKSNAVYMTQKSVESEINSSGTLPVPLHLRNAPTKLMKDVGYGSGYTYDHDAEGGFIAKQGLPDSIADKKFYEPTDRGCEKDFVENLKQLDCERSKKKQ